MLLLALSTSAPIASAALMRDDELLELMSGDVSLAHSETLMPTVDALLTKHGLKASDIDVFAADTGPGSFTGVRMAIAAVNAMAAALNKPVAGVSALEALYAGLDEQDGVICALIDARNGNGYAAIYDGNICISPPGAVSISELLSEIPSDTLFVGDGAQKNHELIRAALPTARFAPGDQNILTAASVAKAAVNKKTQAQILPTYLKLSQAERLHAK